MTVETQNILQLLEQRISAMGAMADSITKAGAAIAACDIASLEARIRDQESLCTRLQLIDQQLDAMQKRQSRLHNQLQSTPELEPLRLAMHRLKEVQSRVKLLNANHAELLRRSRRTINALTNAYNSVALELYSDPSTKNSLVAERV